MEPTAGNHGGHGALAAPDEYSGCRTSAMLHCTLDLGASQHYIGIMKPVILLPTGFMRPPALLLPAGGHYREPGASPPAPGSFFARSNPQRRAGHAVPSGTSTKKGRGGRSGQIVRPGGCRQRYGEAESHGRGKSQQAGSPRSVTVPIIDHRPSSIPANEASRHGRVNRGERRGHGCEGQGRGCPQPSWSNCGKLSVTSGEPDHIRGDIG